MPRSQKSRIRKLQKILEAQREAQALEDVLVPAAEGEEASSSTCPPFPLIPGTPQMVPAAGIQNVPQGLQRAGSSSRAMPSLSRSAEGSRSQVEGASMSQAPLGTLSFLSDAIEDKVVNLVQFLSGKYIAQEPITKADILKNVIKEYKDHFPVIFGRACEYMQVVFGIDVKEADPSGHSYVLINMVDLTYSGMMGDDWGMPKTGLLIVILGVIFMEGNCAPEEKVWEMLHTVGLYTGRKDLLYGEPKKLIARNLVQERYLEYRKVSGSDPVRYEFLWGPRAYAETNKMKILEFFTTVSGTDPTAFPTLYEEALMDERERAPVRIAGTDESPATASEISSALPSTSE